MKSRFLIIATILLSSVSSASAQDFFDTADAPSFFNIGVRLGFNTSNRTFTKDAFNLWTNDSWGTGFNIGAVVNLNFKEYLSIQPGIFFESRNGKYAYLTEYIDSYNKEQTFYQMGTLRAYYISVPVLAVLKFNIANKIKWLVDLGPYFQLKLGESGQDNINVLYRLPQANQYDYYTATSNSFGVGLKLGTGLKFLNHYYLGIHYLAGLTNAWKDPAGGKNKSWEFSVGYDF